MVLEVALACQEHLIRDMLRKRSSSHPIQVLFFKICLDPDRHTVDNFVTTAE